MPTVSATHAKQNFAAMLDLSQREPVRIQRHDRDVAVILSAEKYDQLRKYRLDEFRRLSKRMSAEARANGLTGEILTEILAER